MEILNRTPFIPLLFENQDVDGDDFHVFVLKGTFAIVSGQILVPIPDQAPLEMADRYSGDDPLRSSVIVESDVIPLKQNGEITLESRAVAPGGVPASSWMTSVRIGRVAKELRVTGPRCWEHSLLSGWRLTDPEPVNEVPLRYELAFGGAFLIDDEEVIYDRNPSGVGFYDPQMLDTRLRYRAPQIESVDDPIRAIGRRYEPEGFGPIARHWAPRRELCGTADDKWKEERWPQLPVDFDTDYFNGAPEDLIQPGFFRGDEEIILGGMAEEGELSCWLPGYAIDLYVSDVDDFRIHVAMNLDTIHLNVPERTASLVWRGTFLKMEPLAHVETRISGPGVVRHAG